MSGFWNRKKVSLRGVLTPVSWDESNQVTEVMLTTPEGEDYYVANDCMGVNLLDFFNEVAEVNGFVEDVDGENILEVKSFLVFDRRDLEDAAYSENPDAAFEDWENGGVDGNASS